MTLATLDTSPAVRRVLDQFYADDVVGSVKRGFVARCPAHSDQSRSLSIRVARDGRVVLACVGGCSAHDIVSALGITIADLFLGITKTTATACVPGHGKQQRVVDHQDGSRSQICEKCGGAVSTIMNAAED